MSTCRSLIDDSVRAMFNSTVGTVRNSMLLLLIVPEYADLDLVTAAMLVNNSKQTAQAAQPPAPAYGYNPLMHQYTQPAPNPFQPAPAAQPNNISNIISSLDPATLSQLLGAMSQQNSMPQNPQPAAGLNLDLARLLAQGQVLATLLASPLQLSLNSLSSGSLSIMPSPLCSEVKPSRPLLPSSRQPHSPEVPPI